MDKTLARKSKIESVDLVKERDGDSDVFRAELSIGDHGAAVTVIGFGIDECVERALIIRNAFREIKL